MKDSTRKELADAVISDYNRAARKNIEDDFASVIESALNQR